MIETCIKIIVLNYSYHWFIIKNLVIFLLHIFVDINYYLFTKYDNQDFNIINFRRKLTKQYIYRVYSNIKMDSLKMVDSNIKILAGGGKASRKMNSCRVKEYTKGLELRKI